MTQEEKNRQLALDARPPLENILNLHDFEVWHINSTWTPRFLTSISRSLRKLSFLKKPGHITLPRPTTRSPSVKTAPHTKGMYIPKFTVSMKIFTSMYRVWFRPRILRDVSTVDWSTTILGHKSSLPVYIVSSFDVVVLVSIPDQRNKSATALGKLGHPEGEVTLTRAAAKHGVIQMVRRYEVHWWTSLMGTEQIATLASCSIDDIINAQSNNQTFFLQLYVNRNREITKKYVQHAEERGVKGLFITVDAPQLGRREKDMRMKQVDDSAGAEVQKGQKVQKDQGVARAISVRPSANVTNHRITKFSLSVLH